MTGTYYELQINGSETTRYVFVGSKRDNAQESLHVGFGGTKEEAHRYATPTPIVAAQGHRAAIVWAADTFDERSGYEDGELLWDECVEIRDGGEHE